MRLISEVILFDIPDKITVNILSIIIDTDFLINCFFLGPKFVIKYCTHFP